MSIRTRVVRKEYPGAIVIVEDPFTCAAQPTIQELALALMSDGIGTPSVIVGGRIYTEETEANLDNSICNPV